MKNKFNEPLEAQTLANQVFERILEAIIRGEIAPGQRISEATEAWKLGISRGPLREALLRLEGHKLVKRTPHLGTQVVSMSNQDLVDIFQVREALEGMATRLATEIMTDKEIDELAGVLEIHRDMDELREGAAYYQNGADFDFHYLIAHGSRNEKLVDLLCGNLYYLIRIYRYQSSTRPGRAAKAFIEHEGILNAMRLRDADKAEALMRAHIRRATDNKEQQGEEEQKTNFSVLTGGADTNE